MIQFHARATEALEALTKVGKDTSVKATGDALVHQAVSEHIAKLDVQLDQFQEQFAAEF